LVLSVVVVAILLAIGRQIDVALRYNTMLHRYVAVSLAIGRQIDSIIFVTAMVSVTGLGMGLWGLVLALKNPPTAIRFLSGLHCSIGVFLLVGPIGAYHINGRAWFDYGLTGWNRSSDGTIGFDDYDPKFTRPATWPVIGPVLFHMCWASLSLLICPPIGPGVAILLLTLTLIHRGSMSRPQARQIFAWWAVGLIPQLYFVVWGGNLVEWLLD
jgi:hypothetical protein